MFSLQDNRFDAFIAPAIAQSRKSQFAAGIAVLVAFYTLFLVLLVVGTHLAGLNVFTPNSMETQFGTYGMLASFFFMIMALDLSLRLIHQRDVWTVLGPYPFWNSFWFYLKIFAVILGAGVLFRLWMGEGVRNLSLQEWAMTLPILIPLLLMQVSAEEMVFRGYLLQQFAAISKRPIIWMGIPSLIFGLLHWNGEISDVAGLTVASATLLGILASDLTRRSGSLGPAIALHLVNNFLVLSILPLDGTSTALSLFVSEIHIDDLDQVVPFMTQAILSMFVTLLIYFCIIALLRRRIAQ